MDPAEALDNGLSWWDRKGRAMVYCFVYGTAVGYILALLK